MQQSPIDRLSLLQVGGRCLELPTAESGIVTLSARPSWFACSTVGHCSAPLLLSLGDVDRIGDEAQSGAFSAAESPVDISHTLKIFSVRRGAGSLARADGFSTLPPPSVPRVVGGQRAPVDVRADLVASRFLAPNQAVVVLSADALVIVGIDEEIPIA
jgi:hypothetical protein